MTVCESDLTKQSLRKAVGQVCLAIGWNSIHQGPLNILVDILHKYIQTIGRKSHSRAELYGRNTSNILDIALTFDDLGVNIPDLEEYVQHFEVASAKDVPVFPTPGQDNLNHLRPGSKEVLHRPLHVYDYLPPMYPELEEKEEQSSSVPDSDEVEPGSGSQSTVSTPTSKRREPTLIPSQSEDGRPLREISSVIMTTGGFLSPCREGKLPERGSRHVVPDPEERRQAARRHLESDSDSRGEHGVNIKQEPGDIIPSMNIKQEAPDEDEMDFEQRIAPQEVHSRGKKAGDVKPRYTTSENIDRILDAVVERGLKAGDKQSNPDQSDDDLEPPLDMKLNIKKEENKRGRKKPNVNVKKPPTESSDLFSVPQHFTANAKTPPKQKMSRIPKITEKVTLPSQSSLMSGIGGGLPGLPTNPLIPNFGMNLYGFGQIPASLIPGFNPLAMANAMAMAAASSAANNSRDSSDHSAVTLDDELEEGEISQPDTPTFPARIKTEVSEETSKSQEEEQRDEENHRREEKEREAMAEMSRVKEKEKIERERDKQREIERQKLLLLSKERERLRKIDEEKERKREREVEKEVEIERTKEREKTKEPEKEKKKSKKDKKDKDREKSKKEKKKEKKEKKKMKEKERKTDEPQLFAPVLKIKPVEATPSSTESLVQAITPKLVIKNIPKEPPVIKQEAESIPLLGFQPLRQGPARTPKSSPGKVEKKAKRPSTETPVSGPSSAKKPRETKNKIKSRAIVEADSGDETPGIITETVGSYTDESGNKVWICPACGKQDDGSPMIGCDKCDDWYHWLCVGINSEPSENQDWFCTRCVLKKQV